MSRFGAALCVALVMLFALERSGCSAMQLHHPSRIPSRPTVAQLEVVSVPDGDTIVTDQGRIRLVGFDTPELDEYGGQSAARALRTLLGYDPAHLDQAKTSGPVTEVVATICPQEHKDKYDRWLATVETAAGVDVAETMVGEGYARVLTIAPCGLARARALAKMFVSSFDREIGLWDDHAPVVSACENVSAYEDRVVALRGRVAKIKKTSGKITVQFQPKPKNQGPCASLVVLSKNLYSDRLAPGLGWMLADGSGAADAWVGQTVQAYGKLTRYRGKWNMLLGSPDEVVLVDATHPQK